MTSPHLPEPNAHDDSVDGLRLLVADLQSLADRLGLKDRSRNLRQTLKTTQERVSGPHAVVMVLGQQPELKRRFLERLLGSCLAGVPASLNSCTRLEYGTEAEGVVTMPRGLTALLPLEQMGEFLDRRSVDMPKQTMQTIRLPNSALGRGLAVIDTPPIHDSEPAACVLESAEQADAWIFVLDAGHVLSEASQSLLRRLPESAARLEIIVEGAEALSGEARQAARERLVETLRDRCNVSEPRLTLVASAAGEGDAGSFWHGRFATFHSVMMLRGRERWLEGTRTVVAEALAEAGAEIEFELKSIGLGLRQARLRLGGKDLEVLRTRFAELGRLAREQPREAKPSLLSTAKAPSAATLAATASAGLASGSIHDEHATPATGDAVASGIPPAPMGEPTFVGFKGIDDSTEPQSPRRDAAASFNTQHRDHSQHSQSSAGARQTDTEKVTLPWRMAGVAVAIGFACFILWAVWPRIHLPGKEQPATWAYQPDANASRASSGASAAQGATGNAKNDLPPPVEANAGPDTAGMESTGAAVANPSEAGTATRTALPRPDPTATGSHRARRHRHRFLGLDRVWHWIRHPVGSKHSTEQ